ncbi:MAG: hypothetical protein Q4E59_01045 [Bacteroidales bacterium]|nr:hypothetical protein [Bacteroidales bacterium]
MNKNIILLCALALLLAGCTPYQYHGVTTGSLLGGMFGSSIGGIAGGPRGQDIGTAVGMLAGGAIGAAVTSETEKSTRSAYQDSYAASAPSVSQWSYIEVTNVRFTDVNGNRCLDPEEHAFIEMEIYNRGDQTLYNVAPIVTCHNRRMAVSPTAIVDELAPGRGFRYKVEVIAPKRLKDDTVTFDVAFGNKSERVTAKQFNIRTKRR